MTTIQFFVQLKKEKRYTNSLNLDLTEQQQ